MINNNLRAVLALNAVYDCLKIRIYSINKDCDKLASLFSLAVVISTYEALKCTVASLAHHALPIITFHGNFNLGVAAFLSPQPKILLECHVSMGGACQNFQPSGSPKVTLVGSQSTRKVYSRSSESFRSYKSGLI